MTKFARAYEMFTDNTNVARKDFIATLVEKLGMTPAAASTYHYNCKKKFADQGITEETKEEVKSTIPVKVEAAAPVEKVIADKYEVVVPDCVPAFLLKARR